jgi:hypothetical protein
VSCAYVGYQRGELDMAVHVVEEAEQQHRIGSIFTLFDRRKHVA